MTNPEGEFRRGRKSMDIKDVVNEKENTERRISEFIKREIEQFYDRTKVKPSKVTVHCNRILDRISCNGLYIQDYSESFSVSVNIEVCL